MNQENRRPPQSGGGGSCLSFYIKSETMRSATMLRILITPVVELRRFGSLRGRSDLEK